MQKVEQGALGDREVLEAQKVKEEEEGDYHLRVEGGQRVNWGVQLEERLEEVEDQLHLALVDHLGAKANPEAQEEGL